MEVNILGMIKAIFAGASITKNTLESLQLIKSELIILKQSELETGFSMLNDVPEANDKKKLLEDARQHFYKATKLENTQRLAYAYFGLAVCHFFLQEYKLYRKKLEELSQLEFMSRWQSNLLAFLYGLSEPFPPIVRKQYHELQNALVFQENIKKYLEELNNQHFIDQE